MTTRPGAPEASFTYDTFGRRQQKTVGASTTQYLYDGSNPVQELTPTGLLGQTVATANLLDGPGIDEYFARTDPVNGTQSFLGDMLGSTLALTNSSGAITTSYSYQPFGATTVGGSANGNSYQFTGRENDGTGLYFSRARYYRPMYQRFIAQDPLDFAGGDRNLYAYVGNNPVNWKDPFGLFWWVVPIAPGGGLPVYYALHFSDDPMTNGSLPDSPGIYMLPGLSCGYLFCVVPDDEFNKDLSNPSDLALADLPIGTPMPDQPNKTCSSSK